MRHGDLAVLVAALLFVGNLVLDLECASARLDHLLRKQIRRLGITEARIDICDNRHDMRLEILDLVESCLFLAKIVGCARGIKFAEKQVQLARIRLAEERVQLFDQRRDARLLVHRLVGQRTELRTQRCNHPARKIEVFALRVAEMLLDRNHLLLRDEAVPAAERLRVVGRVGVIGRHVLAHDLRGIARDIQTGAEPVLQAHTGDGFRIDAIPCPVLGADKLSDLGDIVLVRHGL